MASLEVEVTTLTNKKVSLTGVEPGWSELELKPLYQDEEGVPPSQQNLWFPVPEGTEGAQAASAFKWWDKVHQHLEPDLKAAMLAMPLARLDRAEPHGLKTVGRFAELHGGASRVRCFMVLQLAASAGESDRDPSGMSAEAREAVDLVHDAYFADATEAEGMRELRKCFEVFDKDKSGTLSPDELREILTRGSGLLSFESAEQIIADFDTDGDGQISIDEFVKAMGEV